MNATPTCPLAVVALVITGFAEFTVRVRIAVPVPPEFVAPIVTLLVDTTIGVPEMTPLEVLTLSPVGRPLAL